MAVERDRQFVQVIIKAFDLLDIIKKEQPIGISELSRKSNLKKTTVARLVSTLELVRMVEQDPASLRFLLGLRALEYGSGVLENIEVHHKARPLIEKFVNERGTTVLVGVLDQHEVVYIDKVEASELYRIITFVGDRVPAHCTAIGKAMLAFLPPEEVRRIFSHKQLEAFTSKTITTLDDLEKDLAVIKEKGYALDKRERHNDLCSVSAPIFDHRGNVVAAIAVPRIYRTISDAELVELGLQLAELATTISSRLGWKLSSRLLAYE